MSVSFVIADAPRQTIPCEFCEDEREYGAEKNEHGGYCDPWCNGTREVSLAPDANFASANARGVLDLLGYECDDEGLHGEANVAEFRQRLLLASNANRSHLVESPSDLAGGHAGTAIVTDDEGNSRIERRGARVIGLGNTDERTQARLANLQDLCQWAQANNLDTIVWS